MHAAIFLDRDGVIIENRSSYVRSWKHVAIYPQALPALARISASPYKIVMVTNQSAVGRGVITLTAAWEINYRLVKAIEQAGGRIDAVFMCPHAPEEGCDCRKPKPGLIERAAESLGLDLSRSILIGDALSDIQAGQAAGVGQTALVCTGLGKEQARLAKAKTLKPFAIFDSLDEALAALVG